ncbi:uncharacterized protein LOC126843310 [Adelges cooleyi]|uniref:uncharacterized protein LOC126843310 n=1 Tax=Adelges cooleyi TaxID=133065 RepID=UPI00217F61FA|nr:uncharacterized protein LOC126843310 [Adelges cooleyi]
MRHVNGFLFILLALSRSTRTNGRIYDLMLGSVPHTTETKFQFLKEIMKVDHEWDPVLREKVIRPTKPTHIDFLREQEPDAADEKPGDNIIDPFLMIKDILQSSSFVGSFVNYAVSVVKISMRCMASKHVSLHSLLLSEVINREISDPAQHFATFKNILQGFIDKLAIIGERLSPISKLFWHVKLMTTKLDDDGNKVELVSNLQEITAMVYDWVEHHCTPGPQFTYFETLSFPEPVVVLPQDVQNLPDDDIKHHLLNSLNRMKDIIETIPVQAMTPTQWDDILGDPNVEFNPTE